MKVRSRKLYEYLFQAGILNGPEEAITYAKKTYRKLYKKQWQQNRRPRKEIRIEVSLKEYAAIKSQGLACGFKTTTYARNILLASTGQNILIPNKEELLEVLQLLSMAVMASSRNMPARQLSNQLAEAERLLLRYLSR